MAGSILVGFGPPWRAGGHNIFFLRHFFFHRYFLFSLELKELANRTGGTKFFVMIWILFLYFSINWLQFWHIITYYIMVKIVSEGHIRNSETYLWAQSEAEGLIKGSRWFLICQRDDFNHNIHNFISIANKFMPWDL